MSELKRTVLYQAHLDAGATMVDFGGWDMPIQYPDGIVAEHLYCRSRCAIFDVSHMGRIDVEGPDMVRFLQHVLSSNVQALDLNQAQYCIIPDQNGCAIDDAYLYRFEAEKYFLVINAGNIDKDLAHLMREAERYNVTLTNVSDRYAAIAVQGPEAKKMLMTLSGGKALTRENVKNALGTLTMEGRPVRIAKTGYTGEPIGYELYCESRDARYFWDRLIELGARPTALGARDTLRMEASLPLYGHEMGECEFGGEITASLCFMSVPILHQLLKHDGNLGILGQRLPQIVPPGRRNGIVIPRTAVYDLAGADFEIALLLQPVQDGIQQRKLVFSARTLF